MTHAELVDRAARWLRNTRGCGVVLTEFRCSSMQEPDAIGWRDSGMLSILVECKTSVSDFYADANKVHHGSDHGMGRERWYMTSPGLLPPGLVTNRAPGWGLLEVDGRRVRKIIPAVVREPRSLCEAPVFYSIVRRLMIRAEQKPNDMRHLCVAIGLPWPADSTHRGEVAG